MGADGVLGFHSFRVMQELNATRLATECQAKEELQGVYRREERIRRVQGRAVQLKADLSVFKYRMEVCTSGCVKGAAVILSEFSCKVGGS